MNISLGLVSCHLSYLEDRTMWNFVCVCSSSIYLYIRRQNQVFNSPSRVNKANPNLNLSIYNIFSEASNFSFPDTRNGFVQRSLGCKEDHWRFCSGYKQTDRFSAKGVSCSVRWWRPDPEEEICGANLIFKPAFVSSSSQQIRRRVWIWSSNGWLNDPLSWRYLH